MAEILSSRDDVSGHEPPAADTARFVDLDQGTPSPVGAGPLQVGVRLLALAVVVAVSAWLTHQWDSASLSHVLDSQVTVVASLSPGGSLGPGRGRLQGEFNLKIANLGPRDVRVSDPAAHGSDYDLKAFPDWRLVHPGGATVYVAQLWLDCDAVLASGPVPVEVKVRTADGGERSITVPLDASPMIYMLRCGA
jgi:hypothetical protein